MNNQKLILLYSAIALTLLGMWFLLFEKKTVTAVDWNSKYHTDSKKPNDLWLFHSLLTKSYIEIPDSAFVHTVVEDHTLMIMIEKRINIKEDEMTELMRKIRNGNTLLLSAENITIPKLVNLSDHNWGTVDTLAFQLDENTYKITLKDKGLDKCSTWNLQQINMDSSFHYPLKDYILVDYNSKDAQDSTAIDIINTDTIMKCYQIDLGQLCLHNGPQLITNVGSKQAYYLPHFKRLTSHNNIKYFTFIDQNNQTNNSLSPLQYILAKRSFRWAYYLLIFTALVYVYFGGKRKQAQIPLINEKRNTSLEFIYTVSRLYKKQKRHDRLALKMKSNFMAFVENKYYIYPMDEDFWKKLKMKSKIEDGSLVEIKKLLGKLREHKDFSSKELVVLHQILSRFYKQTTL